MDSTDDGSGGTGKHATARHGTAGPQRRGGQHGGLGQHGLGQHGTGSGRHRRMIAGVGPGSRPIATGVAVCLPPAELPATDSPTTDPCTVELPRAELPRAEPAVGERSRADQPLVTLPTPARAGASPAVADPVVPPQRTRHARIGPPADPFAAPPKVSAAVPPGSWWPVEEDVDPFARPVVPFPDGEPTEEIPLWLPADHHARRTDSRELVSAAKARARTALGSASVIGWDDQADRDDPWSRDPVWDTAPGLSKFNIGSVPAPVTPPTTWRRAAWFSVASAGLVLASLVTVTSVVQPTRDVDQQDTLSDYPKVLGTGSVGTAPRSRFTVSPLHLPGVGGSPSDPSGVGPTPDGDPPAPAVSGGPAVTGTSSAATSTASSSGRPTSSGKPSRSGSPTTGTSAPSSTTTHTGTSSGRPTTTGSHPARSHPPGTTAPPTSTTPGT